jgi:hypothetical protein
MSSVKNQASDVVEKQAQQQLSKVESCFSTKYALRGELDSTQKQIFSQLHSDYSGGTDVLEAYVLANSSTTDPYRFPKGQVIIHPVDAKVKSCSINPGLHDHLVMMRVLNPAKGSPEINDAFFRKNEDKINEALPQFAETPARLSMRDENMKDITYWQPELGSNGWAGILKKRNASGRDEDATYYIAVKAGVESAVNDLIEDFSRDEDPKDVTFDELLRYDKDYAYLRNLGQRNAMRGAFRVAQALGLRIHDQDDHRAFKRGQVAKPQMALPLEGDFIQALSTMEVVEKSPKTKVAVHASMCVVPTKVKSECLIMVDPYVGLVGIKMDPKYRGKKATPFKSVAIPVCTGRSLAPENVSTKARGMKKRLKYVVWEKKNGEINDRLAGDAYKQFDENFEQILEEAGWNKRWGRARYTPVVMKVANRKLIRA